MSDGNDSRQEMHSGQYVEILDSVPITRMSRLIPLMGLKREDRIADFGCGTGAFALLVKDLVSRYVGVDFSDDAINFARDRIKKCNVGNAVFHCEDIVSFCDRNVGSFDVVVSNDFTEHIYDKEFLDIFSAAYRTLKPGGSLYIYTPNGDFFWEVMKKVGLARQFPQHVSVRRDDEYFDLLMECGFNIRNIEVAYLPHFNILRILDFLKCIPIIGRYFRAKLFIKCTK